MLSKEEINDSKFYVRATIDKKSLINGYSDLYLFISEVKNLLEYIEQLENKVKQLEADNYEANNIINEYIEERQKIIEKLKADITTFRDKMNKATTTSDKLHYMKRIEYAQEILEMLGGNKNENNDKPTNAR